MLSNYITNIKNKILALKKLIAILDQSKKKTFYFLILFSIVISAIEVIGISAIMPFIAIATDYTNIESNQYYKAVYELAHFNKPSTFVFVFGFVLIGFYIFRSIINLAYTYYLQKFVEEQYFYFANNIFFSYMWLPYQEFIQKNSSNMTKIIMHESAYAAHFIFSFIMMMSELFILILIYIMLLSMSIKITLLITFIFILSAIFLFKFSSKKIKSYGDLRAKVQTKYYEILNKSFGNYKVIKIFSGQQESLNEFRTTSKEFVDITIKSGVLQQLPKFLLEAVGFIIVIIVVMYLISIQADNIDLASAIPMLSVFVLGLYRMLPSVNRIISSFNALMLESKAVQIIIEELGAEKETLGNESILFSNFITFHAVSFCYSLNKYVIKDLNLQIKKGEKIGIIGQSGGGKSTLIALLMGLHKPSNGNIQIDDTNLTDQNLKSWRSKIGYIPQSIYLFDGTIAENIVFGREYNEQKIIDVLQTAHIYDFLQTKEGIYTFVGEGGVLLSGGQKQRIAIARALYGDPEILILDEATSALDSDTEHKVMDDVYNVSRNMTLIIIAHRVSTLDRCDVIYKMENGKLLV